MAAEHHTVAAHRHGGPDLKGDLPVFLFVSTEQHSLHARFHLAYSATDEMGKPGSDAGMPAIEDSEVGKLEDNQFGK